MIQLAESWEQYDDKSHCVDNMSSSIITRRWEYLQEGKNRARFLPN